MIFNVLHSVWQTVILLGPQVLPEDGVSEH
jgi:hypothetical protein